MWGIWREWHTWDEFGQHHATGGSWCENDEGFEMLFASKPEAERLAGMWNALSRRWRYVARLWDD